MYELSQICCVGYLGILSVLDFRGRRIPVRMLILGIGMALLYQVFWNTQPFVLIVAGAATGVLFLGVSRITGEALGYGDSVLILILGIYLGFWKLYSLLVMAFMTAAGFSVFVLALRNFHRKAVFPFVPFLELAYVFLLVGGLS